ncbi:hypothetical protein CAGGBEG34_230012 [Candidatus Glomeribacter gigasporarum BEG34]|uniref:Uncharacterized protein n=1 Tax=Candidatus Glomeribacter gigasporarum BEG34 TaxID=1070319 RepID=G2J9C8_9BURK|nr:hypothetical protein [Candidatus Glomeribacter gigasporarum]CCD29375.1 hypothetical protein CAGGBEG34_230012 [Candidatus Glomeribacter gigasporarum BEG34]
MDFLDEEKHKLSKHAALVQEIYEDRCLHPSKNNILNCIYELQPAGLASLIHQYWNEEDAIFGNRIRERFKRDFLETSQIRTLEITLE